MLSVIRILFVCLILWPVCLSGQLRQSAENPRYFENSEGEIVFLTGSFTWNLQKEIGPTDPPAVFPFEQYLDWLDKRNHNFIRLFTWDIPTFTYYRPTDFEQAYVTPSVYKRTGKELARDGKPTFDLTSFNPVFFDQLRDKLLAIKKRGMYASIMLFECWHADHLTGEKGVQYHPFKSPNNQNSIDAPIAEIYSLKHPRIVALQQAYVLTILELIRDMDHVLLEIANELTDTPAHNAWQYEMIDFIHEQEKDQVIKHPVGMTNSGNGASNAPLFDARCHADWISPGYVDGYRIDPPAADGGKVILNDTDHLWGVGGNVNWVWKSVCRGMNVLYMDPLKIFGNLALPYLKEKLNAEQVRYSMGYAKQMMDHLDLRTCLPIDSLSTTSYCLANPGESYLIFQPESEGFEAQLAKGTYKVYWLDPFDGSSSKSKPLAITQETKARFNLPDHMRKGGVLLLSRKRFKGI